MSPQVNVWKTSKNMRGFAESIFSLLTAVLVTGCATNGTTKANEYGITGLTLAGGAHEDLLIETFGVDAAYEGANYYVLHNPWAPVEPNGLSITPERVRYVSQKNRQLEKYDINVTDCGPLSQSVQDFYKVLADLVPYATGAKDYPVQPYFDGPDYVVELHGNNAHIIISPKTFGFNFPLIQSAEGVIDSIRSCN